MNDLLPTIYYVSFCVGPVYFLFNFLLAQVAGNEGVEFESEFDIDDIEVESTDVFTIDTFSDDLNSDEIGFESSDSSEVIDSNQLRLNYFSPKIWVAIISGFGFGGHFSIEILNKTGISSLVVGIIVGLAAGAFLFYIVSYMYIHTSKYDPPLNIVGRKGLVTLSIPYKKVGLVRVEYDSGNQEFRAQSQHRRKLKKGETVRIVKYIPNRQLVIVKENV